MYIVKTKQYNSTDLNQELIGEFSCFLLCWTLKSFIQIQISAILLIKYFFVLKIPLSQQK